MERLKFEDLPMAVEEIGRTLELIQGELKNLPTAQKSVERFLSLKEAATFLKLKPNTLYNKINQGEVPYMKKSQTLYFLESELTRYLISGKIMCNAEAKEEAFRRLQLH